MSISINWDALIEKATLEIERAIENIMDPNTSPDKVRKITLTISLKATEQRNMVGISTSCSSTLQPYKPHLTIAYIAEANGQYILSEQNPRQLQLDLNALAGEKVVGTNND